MNGRLTIAASLGLLFLAGSAGAAQPWLADRRYGEGIGVQAGRFELHPGISTEFGYDSNFFLRANNENPVDAWRLRVTPSLTLNTAKERKQKSSEAPGAGPALDFQANTFFAYSEIFGNDQVKDQRNFDAGVGARLDIAPTRPLGGDIYGDFLRNGEPSNAAGTSLTFNRGSVRGGTGISWRPGGGLFDWRLGYELAYSYFEDEPYKAYDNAQHSILTRGRWRILPRSGFIYDARYTFVRYRAGSPQPSGDNTQARVGFSGLFTSRLAFLGMIGWNATFYENTGTAYTAKGITLPPVPAQNYDGYVGQAELKYFIMSGAGEGDSAQTGLSSIAVGFTHDANPSYLGAFYSRDRGYATFDLFFAGVFVANIEGGWSAYHYPQVDENLNKIGFTQNQLDLRVFGEYRLSDNFGINATFLYNQAFGKGPHPDGVQLSPGGANLAPTYDNLEYSRYQAYLGLRLFW